MEFLRAVVAWFADPANWQGADGVPARVLEHLQIAGTATVVAALIAIPPAIWLAHRRRGEFFANALVNIGRAVPSLGVLVLAALLFLQVGVPVEFWSIVVALVALAMPPMFTNAYAAIRGVQPGTIEAARGVGLTEREIVTGVELPLGAPVLLAGVRIAFVQVIATTTLGAIVGDGGGLGRYIIDGLAAGFAAGGQIEVTAGALLVALVTLASERAFTLGERLVLPAGIQRMVATSDVAETAGVG